MRIYSNFRGRKVRKQIVRSVKEMDNRPIGVFDSGVRRAYCFIKDK